MIANPTHIAIGIYFKPHLSPIPLISVRETNEVALAVRKYAKEIGIPIITDKKLARKIYATHRRYDYVSFENIDEILRLLLWLEDVENAGQPVPDEQLSSEDKFIEGEDTKIENKDDNLKKLNICRSQKFIRIYTQKACRSLFNELNDLVK
ncbi:hypothetical protein TUM1887_09710 [Escherichia coli]|nr:hypothetical protein TUM1887_09710 [Escherichia coli]GDS85231.1 type III secretion protein SctU [Escherichia coli]STG65043.1 type III secretion system protein [Escherichia coli]